MAAARQSLPGFFKPLLKGRDVSRHVRVRSVCVPQEVVHTIAHLKRYGALHGMVHLALPWAPIFYKNRSPPMDMFYF